MALRPFPTLFLCSLHRPPFSSLHLPHPSFFYLPDVKLRAGRGPRRNQEDAERRAARREREGGPRQVQNTAADPTGQHEAAHRRVRVHVRTPPLRVLPLTPARFFTDNRSCRPRRPTRVNRRWAILRNRQTFCQSPAPHLRSTYRYLPHAELPTTPLQRSSVSTGDKNQNWMFYFKQTWP